MAVRKTYRINLRNYGSPPAVMVSQYDEGYAIAFEIFDGPLPVLASSLSDYTFKLIGRQPGNPPFLAYEFEGTLAATLNAVVSFEIDTTMTGRAGKGTAELVILDEENDVKFASVNFGVYTEPAAVPDGSIDADVQRAMEIAEEVQEIVDTAAAEVKGEAESWAVGQRDGQDVPSTDPAYENNAKYYAEQAAQIAEDISDVTDQVDQNTADITQINSNISELKEDFINKEANVFGLDVIEYTKGYYIDTSTNPVDPTPVASSSWNYAIFECAPLTHVSLIGYGSNVARLWCFVDAEYNVLEVAGPTANTGGDGKMKTYLAPAGTKYCIVNSSNTYTLKYIVKGNLAKTNEIMHLAPSQQLKSYVALEDLEIGYYYVDSADKATFTWSPSSFGFTIIIMDRIMYSGTNRKWAFLLDTNGDIYTNISGANGYAGWNKIFYNSWITAKYTLNDFWTAIINSNGVTVPSTVSIAMKDYVDDSIIGIQVVNSTIKVAVNRYTLTGEHVNKVYWLLSDNSLQDKKYHYVFDHANYKYKLYVLDKNETNITKDRERLVNGILLYADSTLLTENTIYDAGQRSANNDYALDYLSARVRLLQEADYSLKFGNANVWMPLRSYAGDDQIVHPKVLYFPNMLFGHYYWMAYTPYPNANAYYENPCIAYSDDGYRFTNIAGNPIDEPTTDRTVSYFSDTHLVYRADTGKLECWYRLANDSTKSETIYRMFSTDGVTWTDKEELKSVVSPLDSSDAALLSPAVIYEDDKYKIWTVNYNENKIEYWETETGDDWTKVRDIVLTYSAFDETHRIWHIDVEKIDGVYVLVAMTRQTGTRHWPLYLSTSEDNVSWKTPWVVIKYSDVDKWDSRIYRSCIVKVNGVYRIYYSAYDTSDRYHTAISESSDLHHFVGRDVIMGATADFRVGVAIPDVGTKTDEAETVSGTAPIITAKANMRYVCGTVASLSFTPCEKGICNVRFTSGDTPTVLTLPQTVKMPEWWIGTEANKVYEISVADGIYGAVMLWD